MQLAHVTELAGTGTSGAKEKRRKTAPPVARQPETPTAKPKECAIQSVLAAKEKSSENDRVEDMILDVEEMIDLTFD